MQKYAPKAATTHHAEVHQRGSALGFAGSLGDSYRFSFMLRHSTVRRLEIEELAAIARRLCGNCKDGAGVLMKLRGATMRGGARAPRKCDRLSRAILRGSVDIR